MPFAHLNLCLILVLGGVATQARSAGVLSLPMPPLPPETSTGAERNYVSIPAVAATERSTRWWQLRHREKVLQARNGEAQMIMIGDSLVHNFEKRGKQLWYLYFGRYRPLNLGSNSDRTQNVLWRLQNGELDGVKARVAVIMIGTNNGGISFDPPSHTVAGVQAIIREIHKHNADTKVLLLGVFPRGPLPRHKLRRLNSVVNKLLPALADNKSVFYMDISDTFLDKNRILHRSVMFDFLHPTVHGYQLWAEAVSPMIMHLMGVNPLANINSH
ncbi:MAG: beta-glucosidase [Halieaceae bacterium]|jgi:beta-glucosidase